MKPLNKQLANFLIDILIREKSVEAWDHLKTIDLDASDLGRIVLFTPFADEAWELFKNVADKSDFLEIIEDLKDDTKKLEVDSILFEGFEFTREELNKLIYTNNSDWAAKALLGQNPTNDELRYILSYTNLANQAAEELMKRDPDNDDLYEIMDYSSFKKEAWERFIQQSPTIDEIENVVFFTDLEELAWKYLLEQDPTDEELIGFVNNFSETGRKQHEAARILLERRTKKKHLLDFFRMGIYTEEAWDLFMSKKPKYKHLWNLLKYERFKVNEIAEYCLTLKPDKTMLLDVLTYSDKKDEAAAKIIQMPLELDELADVIVHSTIEPILNVVSERVQFDRSHVNEENLIREIASMITSNPDLLDVNNWHHENRHCVGGWAITMNEAAQKIEKKYNSEIAACLLLPNYKHLFFTDKETVLGELEKLHTK